ncbi:hypothetical protein HAHE_06660 [Haloferula helveola]|uniref:Uncharacterized protein n=2 Tax=Haloferula helveola TaxID=490095 RepID=A0ABN6GZW0_9BACT|nr:hypothetical protein HAHE_06660 [Haloferula helveola]
MGPEGSVRVWNSTYKVIMRELEWRAATDEIAARILGLNPAARPIGLVDLTALDAVEKKGFLDLIGDLRGRASSISTGWCFPEQVDRFPKDLDSIIERANEAWEFDV